MHIFKISLILIWFLLLGMLLHRDYFVRTLDSREVMALERDRRVENRERGGLEFAPDSSSTERHRSLD